MENVKRLLHFRFPVLLSTGPAQPCAFHENYKIVRTFTPPPSSRRKAVDSEITSTFPQTEDIW